MTNETEVELLPCPFCGAPAIIEDQPSYSQAANTYFRFRAWCNDCCFGLDWHAYEAEAIAAWNTRASRATDTALAEELRRYDCPEACIGKTQYIPISRETLRRILAVLEGKRT